jgi:hypothetical protein
MDALGVRVIEPIKIKRGKRIMTIDFKKIWKTIKPWPWENIFLLCINFIVSMIYTQIALDCWVYLGGYVHDGPNVDYEALREEFTYAIIIASSTFVGYIANVYLLINYFKKL